MEGRGRAMTGRTWKGEARVAEGPRPVVTVGVPAGAEYGDGRARDRSADRRREPGCARLSTPT
ncbi:hypothetical protein GCM10010279_52740 [Streptomyces mutabilis]|nr:hypothetical protein GCM10010279_52740 [Streptomyces mutabilis]